MGIEFINEIEGKNALLAEFEGRVITVPHRIDKDYIDYSEAVARPMTKNYPHYKSVFKEDRFISIEILYNASKECYYMEWPSHGIYKIVPGGVYETYITSGMDDTLYHEDQYGYIVYGRYLFSPNNLGESSYARARTAKFETWIKSAFCYFPKKIATYT